MKTPHLSAIGLRRALRAGTQRVLAQSGALNRLNVFPVADHDTGSNLAATLGAVLHGLGGLPPGPVRRALDCAAAEALDYARGGSGALLAHFFQGAAEAVAPDGRLSSAVLAQAVAAGASRARASLAEPAAGTILSVMQAFADELQTQAGAGVLDLRACFPPALARAQAALARTPEQLPVLRAAGVVDAGAAGWVALLEGVADYLARGRGALPAMARYEPPAAGIDVVPGDPDTAGHGIRVECLVRADGVDRAGLKAALLALPLSHLMIEGSRRQVRVHARLASPARFLEAAARFGVVSGQRLAPAAERSNAVAIVTDSGGDVPEEARAELGIHVVPARLTIDGRDHVDGVSLSSREFYDAMRTSAELPRTSQPPPGDFRRMFEHLLTQHDQVIDVSLSGTLSGALQAAAGAAARTSAERISVFDSRQASGAQGLLAIWAAEAAQAGLDAPRILAGLDRMRPRTALYGVIRDVRYGVRGGRVPRVALPLTRLLRLFLFARNRADGRLGLLGGLWGRHRLPERFARKVARRLDPARCYRLLIGHCDSPAEAERVKAALQASVARIDRIWVMDAGVAIGAHAGPGSLLISVQDYEPPQP